MNPFGNFQTYAGGRPCSGGSSAPAHNAAFSTLLPQRAQHAGPQIFPAARGPSYTLAYASDHNISNTFAQAPIASQRMVSALQTVPLPPVAQMQPPARCNVRGQLQPSSWNINVPPLPVNVNIPPPPSANVNVPPHFNRNIPPPGFNPRIPPPPVFGSQCRPPVVASSASVLTCSSSVVTPARWALPFTSRNSITDAHNQRCGAPPLHVHSFVSRQRLPTNNVNGTSGSWSTSVHQSSQGSVCSEVGNSYLPSVNIATVCGNSTVCADKNEDDDKCCEGKSLLLSTAEDKTLQSSEGATDVSTTLDSLVSSGHRRRRSSKNNITFAKFRLLLKEAILINSRLRKYTEKHTQLYNESPADDSDNLTLSDFAEKYRSDDADKDNTNSDSVSVDSSREHGNMPAEKRTVKIMPASQYFASSSVAMQPGAETSSFSVIDFQEAIAIRDRLKDLQIEVASHVDAVVARQKRAASKRLRLKRRRRSVYEAHCDMLTRRQRRHEEIDKYTSEIQQKQRAAKMECEMKDAADSTLAEVRRKITDTSNCMKLISRLQKLRQLRKDQAERKGIVVRRSSDEVFVQRVEALSTTLRQQMALYEAEQRTLQVMLETEHEQTKEKEREREQVKMNERLTTYERQLHTWLFGSQSDPVEPMDTMYPYTQYYDLANYNIDTFVKIRQEWDMYAVPADAGTGSRIPPVWVTPSEPADDAWASALKHS